MRTWLLAVLAIGCDGSSSRPVDAKLDEAACKADLEASIDRSCSTAADCALVMSADCCGVVVLAVKRGTESAFPARETAYETCLACPPLGCDHAETAEEGGVPGAGQSIMAACNGNRCKAIVGP